MLNGIYSSATALNTSSIQHEVVANNLANVNSTGFRRMMVEVHELASTSNASADSDSGLDVSGNQVTRIVTDFTPGTLESTGRKLDFAISGDGFFSIESPEGTRYTRNGFFQVNTDGQLTTADGHQVLSNGGPIQFPPGADVSRLTTQSDGTLMVDQASLGKLDIVDFADKKQLVQMGSANFAAPPGMEPNDATGQLVQGSLERSNTNSVSEMIQMITGSRHFESAQRALRTIAESIEKFTNMDQ